MRSSVLRGLAVGGSLALVVVVAVRMFILSDAPPTLVVAWTHDATAPGVEYRLLPPAPSRWSLRLRQEGSPR